MFRRSFESKKVLAWLLPFTLFWGWAACISVCAENSDNHDFTNAFRINELQSDEGCAGETDDCTITPNGAAGQERRIVKSFAPETTVGTVSPYGAKCAARFAPQPEVNQNSPPDIPPEPLFVRFCAFRI